MRATGVKGTREHRVTQRSSFMLRTPERSRNRRPRIPIDLPEESSAGSAISRAISQRDDVVRCRVRRERLLRFYLVGLFAIDNPDGWRAAGRARARGWPSEAWMSTKALVCGVQSVSR